VAEAQQGLVTRIQLGQLGLRRGAIAHRVSTGRLHPAFPGVFFVGYRREDPEALMLGALLRADRDCVLSHGSAAYVWGLIDRPPPEVHITLLGRNLYPASGVNQHRVKALDVRDVRLRRGLPVTSPARTLTDVAGESTEAETVAAVARARVQRLITDRDLKQALGRCGKRAGVSMIRSMLRDEQLMAPSRSEAERLLLSVIARAGLPAPATNSRVLGMEVDFLWAEARLIVEVDGYAFHGHRRAFERDRRRDQALVAAGFRVIRVTWRQLAREPLAVVAAVAQALALSRA
jgi:very-short-patch-repair endonuclease